MKRLLVIHGPNLNLLGEREPHIYGSMTLNEINHILQDMATEEKFEIEFYQSNHEGKIIDFLHEKRKSADGILMNPAALAHTSIALRDAIAAINIPTIEVHLTDIHKREDFRRISVTKGACMAQFIGEGIESYKKGLKALMTFVKR
jgi:3-dehydroquinate dehydratase-2